MNSGPPFTVNPQPMIPKAIKYVLFVLAILTSSFRLTAQCIDVTVVGNTAFVTSTANIGFGTLRAAMICVNDAASGVNEINFNVPGAGDVVIAPNALLFLPTITKDNVVIDARTQPGWTLGKVILDGVNSISNGFTVSADNVSIHGFFIQNFTNATNGSGIELSSGSGHLIDNNALSGNRVGILGGTTILSFTATNNTIGLHPSTGTALGNSSQGIFISPSFSLEDFVISNNTIAYNSVGVQTLSLAINALISENSMYCNALGGIDRGGFTVSPFSITSASTLEVSGQGPSGATIELFSKDDSGCATIVPCQGTNFLGSTTIPGSLNDWSINVSGLVNSTDEVTITATIGGNSTTEFSGCSALSCPTITVSFINTTDACSGQSNGSATAVPLGGTGPYTFFWSDSQTGETASNLPAGSHSVVVTDASGCTGTGIVTIGTATAPTVSPSSNSPICEGETISLMANPNDMGLSPLSFSWEGPNSFMSSDENPTIANASLSTGGTYQVTVTGSNNCSSRMETTVVVNETPSFTLTPFDLECNGTAEGRIELNISNPNDFTYNWSNGANTQNLSNLPAGNYSVTVTHQITMCSSSDATTVDEPDALSLDLNPSDPTCGSNNGSIQAIPGGGTPNYTYAWSNSQTDPTAINLGPGIYEVTVTDMNGCTIIDQTTLSDVGGPMLAPDVIDVACNGEATGLIDLNISGGTPPITINWSNGASTETISNLTAGTYEATVTDGNGCQSTTSQMVNQPSALAASIDTSPSACASATGTATATVNGGTPGYSIQWDNGDSGGSASNLTPGNHMVTITDNQNCQIIETFIIATAQPPTVTIISTVDVACNGEATGSINIDASGGLPPYDYNWSDGSTSQNLENAPAGNYSVTVNDQNGCVAIANGTIDGPLLPLLLTTSSTDATCGQPDGTASANVNGGTLPYTINWSNGVTGATITGLSSGVYEVTVTDGNNCTATGIVGVSDIGAPVLGTLVGDVTCNGEEDGVIILSITGGTMPFDISWSNGGTGQMIENLSPGNYSVTVEDANQCLATIGAIVFEPDVLDITLTVSGLDCTGNNSAITADVTGGTPNYTYAWSNGANTPDIDNLEPGDYTLTVSDALNCTSIESITIPAFLSLTITNTTSISMIGAEDGSVTFEVSGGTAPFNYEITGPESESSSLAMAGTVTVSDLLPGSYTLEITDDNGCTQIANFIINDAGCGLVIDSTQVVDISCAGNANGQIEIFVSGGTQPLSYNWDGTNGTGNGSGTVIENLAAGTYSITIEDANLCRATVDATIFEPEVLVASLMIDNLDCTGDNSTIMASVTGGTTDYTYAWSNGFNTPNVDNLSPGDYTLTVTDALNCTAIESLTIPENITLQITNTTPVSMMGAEDGSVTFDISGGTAPFNYVYTGPESGNDVLQTGGSTTISDLLPGSYALEITDGNSCTQTATFIISNAGCDLVIDSIQIMDSSCAGVLDGQINVFVSGGDAPFSYNWNGTNGTGNGTGTTVENLEAGEYQISISDLNSCVDTISATVNENLSLPSPNAAFISECPQADGSGLFDLTALENTINPSPDASVNWYEDATGSQPIGNPSAYASSGGTVYATLFQNGCESGSTPIPLEVLPPDDPECQSGVDCDIYGVLNFIQGLDSLCQGQPLELSTNDLGAPEITYFWVHPNGDTAQTTTPFYTIPDVDPSQEGEFFVFAEAPGCFFDETGPFILTVEGLRDGETIDAGEDLIVCDGEVTLNASPISSATAFWSSTTGNNITTSNSPTISINDLQPGENEFIWNVTTTGCGQIGSDTVRVILETPPIANDDFFTLQRANTEIFMDVLKNDNITPDLSIDFYAINQPAFGELETLDNGFRYFEKEGQRGIVYFDYVVCNLDSNCPNACDTARVTIDVLNLPHLPEGISPNNDGVNDELTVLGFFENDAEVTMKVTITNRWGEIVYESADYTRSTPWNGRLKNNGKPLPQGAYYCAIEIQVEDALYQETQTVYLVK